MIQLTRAQLTQNNVESRRPDNPSYVNYIIEPLARRLNPFVE